MHQALRPYVTTGVAIVGASVLVAAPLTATPQAAEPLVRHVEAGVIPTAASSPLSTISTAIGAGLQIGIDTVAGLPLGLTLAATAIINDPDSTADVINYLANSFLNPNPLSGSVFSQIGIRVILPLTSLLPPAAQAKVLQVFGEISVVIGEGLAKLPGSAAAGGLALYYAGITLATEKPELLAELTHIQETGEALGEKVFDVFSHGSAPEMVAFRESDAPKGVVEDGEDNGKSGLPILSHILHPQKTPDAEEVEVEEPSKPQFGLLRGSLFAGEKSGPGSFLNGSRLGCDEEEVEAADLGNAGRSEAGVETGVHRLGLPGKVGVGDLVKKVLGGLDKDKKDDVKAEADATS